ncbi:restriction endonuclease subunit S [Celeribacter halophilus]|uniref:restriction endonuclease subunit S n=1 Tax=Celeribacter halophilus TaxID=576117 RepID=UPI003A905033
MAGAAKYQPYPAYKPSGVEWVGDIPEEWDVRPLFGVAATESRKNETGEEKNVLSLSYGNIVSRDVETNFGLLPASFNTYQLVEVGEIILRLTDLQNDKRSLRVGHSKQKGIITSAYLKLIAEKTYLSDYYLYLLLHSYDTTKVFYGMGGGLRQSMKFEEMRRLPILLPSLPEQTKIAAFLDYETAKIDALISKQERLIALLEEKRQAVISHAVTKGLDPTAPMRPSGIDWLGDVPEHWEVKRLKHIASIFGRIGFRGYTVDDIVDEGEGAIVLSPSNIKDERFSLEKRSYVSWEKYYESPEIIVSAGDILLVKTGSTFGKSTFVRSVDEPMTINPQMALIKIDKKWAEFVSFFLRTALIKATIEVSNTGSGMPTMTQENLGGFPVLIAPNDETNQIVEYLNGKSEIFDNLIAKGQSAITLLKERRIALISAAVTGKIDVRDWQRPEGAQAAAEAEAADNIQDERALA